MKISGYKILKWLIYITILSIIIYFNYCFYIHNIDFKIFKKTPFGLKFLFVLTVVLILIIEYMFLKLICMMINIHDNLKELEYLILKYPKKLFKIIDKLLKKEYKV